MIKAVIFDIDNTLYDFSEANRAGIRAMARYAAPLFSMSEDELIAFHKKTQDELTSRLGNVAASHSRLIRYQLMLEKYSIPFHPHLSAMYSLFWDTLIGEAEPYPDAEPAMRLIKDRGQIGRAHV